MLHALTALEGLLPVLAPEAILRPLLCAAPAPAPDAGLLAQPAAAGEARLVPAPLLAPLLRPHPSVDPQLRNRVAGLVLQACDHPSIHPTVHVTVVGFVHVPVL